jgi:hypothetical protein
MMAGLALVASMAVAQAPVDTSAPVETVPVVQPVAPAVPVVAVVPVVAPVGPPMAVAPAPVGPPDLEALDRQYGAYYLESKGKGLRVGGALAVVFGAFQVFTALICLGTAAGLHDSGELDTARTLGLIGAGFGAFGLVHIGGGVPMLIVGKARQRRYHAWLLGQPPPGASRGFSVRPGAAGAGPLGLSLMLRF